VTPASIVALAVAGARWWHTWPEHAAAGVALVVLAFLAVVAQVTDAIVVLTDEQRITSWNAGAEQLFGVSASEAIGRSASDLLATLFVPDDVAQIRAAVLETGHWRGETMFRQRDGSMRHVEAIVQALDATDGGPGGRLIVVHDIHERKTRRSRGIASSSRSSRCRSSRASVCSPAASLTTSITCSSACSVTPALRFWRRRPSPRSGIAFSRSRRAPCARPI
jgi:PAS domain S-box-containing protein